MMKRKSSTLKIMAREALAGNYALPIGAMLFLGLLAGLGTSLTTFLFGQSNVFEIVMSQMFSIVISLIVSIFGAGLSYMFLKLSRGEEAAFSDLFYMFRHHPDRVIVVSVVLTIIQYIGMLPYLIWSYKDILKPMSKDIEVLTQELLVMLLLLFLGVLVSGLISLPFLFSYYILLDDKEAGALEALKLSMRMMKGNYWRYIWLQLSFTGWFILGVWSCYLGFLWIAPYMKMTVTQFYRDVKGELDEGPPSGYNEPIPAMGGVMSRQNQTEQEDFKVQDDYNAEA